MIVVFPAPFVPATTTIRGLRDASDPIDRSRIDATVAHERNRQVALLEVAL